MRTFKKENVFVLLLFFSFISASESEQFSAVLEKVAVRLGSHYCYGSKDCIDQMRKIFVEKPFIAPEVCAALQEGRRGDFLKEKWDGRGCVVAQVKKGSPFDCAGVVPGDIVCSINGHQVNASCMLSNDISLYDYIIGEIELFEVELYSKQARKKVKVVIKKEQKCKK